MEHMSPMVALKYVGKHLFQLRDTSNNAKDKDINRARSWTDDTSIVQPSVSGSGSGRKARYTNAGSGRVVVGSWSLVGSGHGREQVVGSGLGRVVVGSGRGRLRSLSGRVMIESPETDAKKIMGHWCFALSYHDPTTTRPDHDPTMTLVYPEVCWNVDRHS